MIALRRARLAYCETDKWRFDPRYTQGRCPICGWEPAGAPKAPAWLAFLNRLDWELLGLLMLLDVLVLFGLIVAHGAGLIPAHVAGPSMPVSGGAAGAAASSARTP